MKSEARHDVTRILKEEGRAIDEALKRGVRQAMIRHKQDGRQVVIERDGKIERVKPEDLGY